MHLFSDLLPLVYVGVLICTYGLEHTQVKGRGEHKCTINHQWINIIVHIIGVLKGGSFP